MDRRIRFFSVATTLSILVSVNPAYAVAEPKPLPGVKATELSTNLENRAWKCTKPKDTLDSSKVGKNATTFNCSSKDKTANVVVWGTNARDVTWINVDANTKISYGWPRFIATLPIDGVDPTAAQKWVTSALNGKKSASKIFSDIKFSVVIGSGVARTLTIAHKNTKQPQ